MSGIPLSEDHVPLHVEMCFFREHVRAYAVRTRERMWPLCVGERDNVRHQYSIIYMSRASVAPRSMHAGSPLDLALLVDTIYLNMYLNLSIQRIVSVEIFPYLPCPCHAGT